MASLSTWSRRKRGSKWSWWRCDTYRNVGWPIRSGSIPSLAGNGYQEPKNDGIEPRVAQDADPAGLDEEPRLAEERDLHVAKDTGATGMPARARSFER